MAQGTSQAWKRELPGEYLGVDVLLEGVLVVGPDEGFKRRAWCSGIVVRGHLHALERREEVKETGPGTGQGLVPRLGEELLVVDHGARP